MRAYKLWTIDEHWTLMDLIDSGKKYKAKELAAFLPGRTRIAVKAYLRRNQIPLPRAHALPDREREPYEP